MKLPSLRREDKRRRRKNRRGRGKGGPVSIIDLQKKKKRKVVVISSGRKGEPEGRKRRDTGEKKKGKKGVVSWSVGESGNEEKGGRSAGKRADKGEKEKTVGQAKVEKKHARRPASYGRRRKARLAPPAHRGEGEGVVRATAWTRRREKKRFGSYNHCPVTWCREKKKPSASEEEVEDREGKKKSLPIRTSEENLEERGGNTYTRGHLSDRDPFSHRGRGIKKKKEAFFTPLGKVRRGTGLEQRLARR